MLSACTTSCWLSLVTDCSHSPRGQSAPPWAAAHSKPSARQIVPLPDVSRLVGNSMCSHAIATHDADSSPKAGWPAAALMVPRLRIFPASGPPPQQQLQGWGSPPAGLVPRATQWQVHVHLPTSPGRKTQKRMRSPHHSPWSADDANHVPEQPWPPPLHWGHSSLAGNSKPPHHHRQLPDCSEAQGTTPPARKAKPNQASTSSPVAAGSHTPWVPEPRSCAMDVVGTNTNPDGMPILKALFTVTSSTMLTIDPCWATAGFTGPCQCRRSTARCWSHPTPQCPMRLCSHIQLAFSSPRQATARRVNPPSRILLPHPPVTADSKQGRTAEGVPRPGQRLVPENGTCIRHLHPWAIDFTEHAVHTPHPCMVGLPCCIRSNSRDDHCCPFAPKAQKREGVPAQVQVTSSALCRRTDHLPNWWKPRDVDGVCFRPGLMMNHLKDLVPQALGSKRILLLQVPRKRLELCSVASTQQCVCCVPCNHQVHQGYHPWKPKTDTKTSICHFWILEPKVSDTSLVKMIHVHPSLPNSTHV